MLKLIELYYGELSTLHVLILAQSLQKTHGADTSICAILQRLSKLP